MSGYAFTTCIFKGCLFTPIGAAEHSQIKVNIIVMKLNGRKIFRQWFQSLDWPYSFKCQLIKISSDSDIYSLIGFHPFIKVVAYDEGIELRLVFKNIVPNTAYYVEPSFIGDLAPAHSKHGFYNEWDTEEHIKFYSSCDDLIIYENIKPILDYINDCVRNDGGAIYLIASGCGTGHGALTTRNKANLRCKHALASNNELNDVIFFAKAKSSNYLKFNWSWC